MISIMGLEGRFTASFGPDDTPDKMVARFAETVGLGFRRVRARAISAFRVLEDLSTRVPER